MDLAHLIAKEIELCIVMINNCKSDEKRNYWQGKLIAFGFVLQHKHLFKGTCAEEGCTHI